jgi:hypothetical protein
MPLCIAFLFYEDLRANAPTSFPIFHSSVSLNIANNYLLCCFDNFNFVIAVHKNNENMKTPSSYPDTIYKLVSSSEM